MKHSRNLLQLIDALRALPGVGPKTAQRMAFHLLQEGRPGARALAQALATALDSVRRCRRCRMLTDDELCSICSAPQRDQLARAEFFRTHAIQWRQVPHQHEVVPTVTA